MIQLNTLIQSLSTNTYGPDLPGCVVAGVTREEAISLIQEAIEFHLEGLRSSGEAVPLPKSQSEVVDVHAA